MNTGEVKIIDVANLNDPKITVFSNDVKSDTSRFSGFRFEMPSFIRAAGLLGGFALGASLFVISGGYPLVSPFAGLAIAYTSDALYKRIKRTLEYRLLNQPMPSIDDGNSKETLRALESIKVELEKQADLKEDNTPVETSKPNEEPRLPTSALSNASAGSLPTTDSDVGEADESSRSPTPVGEADEGSRSPTPVGEADESSRSPTPLLFSDDSQKHSDHAEAAPIAPLAAPMREEDESTIEDSKSESESESESASGNSQQYVSENELSESSEALSSSKKSAKSPNTQGTRKNRQSAKLA